MCDLNPSEQMGEVKRLFTFMHEDSVRNSMEPTSPATPTLEDIAPPTEEVIAVVTTEEDIAVVTTEEDITVVTSTAVGTDPINLSQSTLSHSEI